MGGDRGGEAPRRCGVDVVVVADVGGRGANERWHIGDEAMLASNLALLGPRAARRVRVASTAPVATRGVHGVEAVLLPELVQGGLGADLAALESSLQPGGASGPTRGLAAAIIEADVVWFSGAGNLTSVFRDRLLERVAIGRAARAAGARMVLTGQTIGPDLDQPDRMLVGELLAGASHVGVRDPTSLRLAGELGVDAVLQLDDAFTFADAVIDAAPLPPRSRPTIGVTLHHSPAGGPGVDIGLAAARLDELCQAVGADIAFIPHYSDGPGIWADAPLMAEVGRALTAPNELLALGSAEDAVRAVRRCSLVVSTRYHPIVFGLRCGVPSLGLAQDAYHEAKLRGATAPYKRAGWVLDIARLMDRGALVGAGAPVIDPGRGCPDLAAANDRLGRRATAERRVTLSAVAGEQW